MVSKIVIVACAAVAAVALFGQDDNYGNESGGISKVVIAAIVAMAAYAFVGRLSGKGSESTTGKFKGWTFPPDGWIKCNVDGSAPPKSPSGCGGVFRDANGSWLYGFARSLESCNSSAAELEGISTGLEVAWDKGFRKLILVTDSLTAADVVNNKNGASAHLPNEKKLVQSIRCMLENRKWDDVRIVHNNGGANKVADWLADLSHGLKVGDQLDLPKLPDGCRSCHDLMDEDTKHAKLIKEGRSDRL